MQPLRAPVHTQLSFSIFHRALVQSSSTNGYRRAFGHSLAGRRELEGISDEAKLVNHGRHSQRSVHSAPLPSGKENSTGGSPSNRPSPAVGPVPSTAPEGQAASDKLFADALREEEEEPRSASRSMSRVQQLASQAQLGHENWTGDEEIKDAVLRMLVDKYKPLRSRGIQSAEEKMKKGGVPDVGRRAGLDESTASLTEAIITGSSSTAWKPPLEPTTGSWANEPLLPSNPSHKPWDTKYSVPWHREAAIKTGNNQPKKPKLSETEDANQKKRDREAMRRQMMAGRLTSAREATLDYKLGIKRGLDEQGARSARPNPSTMKGWGGYVEDKIEVCS